jgi:UDPglucose--hexose-1-phosphate uridylyltransferase
MPHRRFNPLASEWVLVSPHRARRPWLGQVESAAIIRRPSYDPACYLCPGNARAEGQRNPAYAGTYVFTNDFAALLPHPPPVAGTADDLLFQAIPEPGTCRVVCFSPRHDLTLAELPEVEIAAVIRVWMAQTAKLGQRYEWVQVFENKGEAMGASNPHPHGQIWASTSVPDLPERENRAQRAYYAQRGAPLLGDYGEREERFGERVVVQNAEWRVVVPYWAVWPFETLVLPRRQVARLSELGPDQVASLAVLLKRMLTKYDNLFDCPFPYSMGWHGAPFDASDPAHWWLHAHFFPPLLRSATIKKFMVGFELLAEPQRDLTPEAAAERLRGLSDERCYSTTSAPDEGTNS